MSELRCGFCQRPWDVCENDVCSYRRLALGFALLLGVRLTAREQRVARGLDSEPVELCGSCGADIGPSATFPWHEADEDCRALRDPVQEAIT